MEPTVLRTGKAGIQPLRRGLFILCCVFVLTFTLALPAPSFAAPAARRTIPLRQGWRIRQLDEATSLGALLRDAAHPDKSWMPATMPAQVHDVLIARGALPDPHIGKNAAACAWVGDKDWAYATDFASPAGDGPVNLRFLGLDTLATAYLNGREIGRFDDMFRTWSVEVSKHLAPAGASNQLLIVFHSPTRFIKEAAARFSPPQGIAPAKYLRKSTSDQSSYMGARPNFMTVGIFDDVLLDVPERSWLQDLCVRPALTDDFKHADLAVLWEAAGAPAALDWTLTDPDGKPAGHGTVEPGRLRFPIAVDKPRLWWPHTHGTPSLYKLDVALTSAGRTLDRRSLAVGIRRIRPILEEPATHEKRFAFEVNGRRLFLMGADWAPVEGATHVWQPARARRLLDLAVAGRMNVIRVWAEGLVPPQDFYDECDRRGILVWQDFMFGYGMHPMGPPEFDEARRAEAEDIIRRLRNHPSLLLWVGGNENHMGWNFSTGNTAAPGAEFFGRVLPELCRRLDPDRLFHPSSPYGGPVPNWPLEGDWHDYTTLTFSPQASVPTYASEVGRVSPPSVASMRRYLSPEELWPAGFDPRITGPGGQPAWPPMWQYRSVGGSWDKIGPIEEFCDPVSAEDLSRALGTAHGEYLQRRVERHRRGVPDGAPDAARRCWGNMVWRLNDAWPIAYWSVIDYYLEPKIPYYFLRRAYAPVQVSLERTPDWLAAWVINDGMDAVKGKLVVRHLDFKGKLLHEKSQDVELAPGASKRCFDLSDFGPIKLRNEFLLAEFSGQQTTLLLTGERYLHLPPAKLTTRRTPEGIEIATDNFARQVTLEAAPGAVFEDNFFDLPPGQRRVIKILDAAANPEIKVSAFNAKEVIVNRNE